MSLNARQLAQVRQNLAAAAVVSRAWDKATPMGAPLPVEGNGAQAFGEHGGRASTGTVYDSTSMQNDARIAIRIGSKVFMPDEELAQKVTTAYKSIERELPRTSDQIAEGKLKNDNPTWNTNRAAFERVKAKIHNAPDLRVGPYTVRFRLSYSPAEAQGEVSVAHIKVTAMDGGTVRPVWFVPLQGALAKDIYMPY